MAVITKNGKKGKTYAVIYRDDDGKQRQETFKLKKDALALDGEIRFRKRKGTLAHLLKRAQVSDKTFDQQAQDYLDLKESTGMASFRSLQGFVKELLRTFGGMKLREIKYSDLERYRANLETRQLRGNGSHRKDSVRDNKLSYATIQKYMTTLHAILQMAVRDKVLQENPFGSGDAKKRLFVRKDKMNIRTRVLDMENELEGLVDAMPDPVAKLWVLIECQVGVRPGELLRLTKDRLFEDHFVLRAKDRKNRRPQVVPLNAKAQGYFRDLRLYLATQGDISSPWVFQEPDNSGRQYRTFYTRWRKACQDAGIEGLQPRDLRPTFITALASRTRDIHVVKAALGDNSSEMAFRYVKDAEQRYREAVLQMEDFTGSVSVNLG